MVVVTETMEVEAPSRAKSCPSQHSEEQGKSDDGLSMWHWLLAGGSDHSPSSASEKL